MGNIVKSTLISNYGLKENYSCSFKRQTLLCGLFLSIDNNNCELIYFQAKRNIFQQ